ncbi:hypothetical protein OAE23_01245 [Synechococcus sp. AH-551-E11]|nr:hypothetical protein [Synechococcus sp. AH-551-E11]
MTNACLDVVFTGRAKQMTLVFPIGTGGTFDRLPADQTLKHGAHDFQFHHASLLSHVPDPRFVHADAI